MNGDSASGPPGPRVNLDAYPRRLGVLFLLIGLICGAVAFYFPIKEVLEGATKITLSWKTVSAFFIFTLVGLIFIIFGPIPARLAIKYAGLKRWQKWLIIGLLVLAFGASAILEQEAIKECLEKLGYQVKFE